MNPKSLLESSMRILSLHPTYINMTALPTELALRLHKYMTCVDSGDNCRLFEPCKRKKYIFTTRLLFINAAKELDVLDASHYEKYVSCMDYDNEIRSIALNDIFNKNNLSIKNNIIPFDNLILVKISKIDKRLLNHMIAGGLCSYIVEIPNYAV